MLERPNRPAALDWTVQFIPVFSRLQPNAGISTSPLHTLEEGNAGRLCVPVVPRIDYMDMVEMNDHRWT